MTIVAHEWYISPQYLTKLFKNFKYLKINTIDLQGPAWNFLKNTSLSQPVFYLSKENVMKPLVNFGVPW